MGTTAAAGIYHKRVILLYNIMYVCMPKKFGRNTNISETTETVVVQVGWNVNLQTWETRAIKTVYEELIILTVNVYYYCEKYLLTFL